MSSRRGSAVTDAVVISVVGALVVVILAALALVGVVPIAPSTAPTAPWREDVSLAASALMLVLVVAGLVSMRRAKVLDPRGWSGVWSLPRAQRRQVLRAVRAGEAVAGDQVAAAMVVARALRRQGAGWLLYAGITLNIAGQLVSARSLWGEGLLAAGLVLLVPSLVVISRDGRRARAWLDAHQRHADAEATAR